MAGTTDNTATTSGTDGLNPLSFVSPINIDVGSAETIFRDFIAIYSANAPHITAIDFKHFDKFVWSMEFALGNLDPQPKDIVEQLGLGLRDHLILWYEPYCNKDSNATTKPDYRNIEEEDGDKYAKWVLSRMTREENDNYTKILPLPAQHARTSGD